MSDTIGTRLRRAREEKGLNQVDVGEAVGISRSYLSDIEAGKKDGSIKTISALAQYYDVSLDYLAGLSVPSVQSPENTAHDEREVLLLKIWRAMSDEERLGLMALLKARIDTDAA
ncbi:helix-turn-helix transcriptional regulator [Komagataeibacter intermedius]|uniref:helix-turn-helix transcriptional regulator n=1 Tax=Komagataeibacter intermedius TaxID=66229 RepID=UPI003B42BA0E